MKFIIFLVGFAIAVLALPQQPIPIISSENHIEPDGRYHYSYETGNGIKAEQQGEPRAIGNEIGNAASGQFSFSADDGTSYSVSYTADENGYQPQGQHIHPIPAAILKAIEWNKAHPEQDNQKQ